MSINTWEDEGGALHPDEHPLATLRDCARCGKTHVRAIDWRRFQSPVVDDDGTKWTHWALCPGTGDPVLMRFTEDA